MTIGQDWSGYGAGYKPPVTGGSMGGSSFLDPILANIPGIGNYIREQNPDVAMESWLSKMYIPPQLKLMLQSALPNLFRKHLLGVSQAYDMNKGFGGIPDFQTFLAGQDPFRVLQDMMSSGQVPQTRAGDQQGRITSDRFAY